MIFHQLSECRPLGWHRMPALPHDHVPETHTSKSHHSEPDPFKFYMLSYLGCFQGLVTKQDKKHKKSKVPALAWK